MGRRTRWGLVVLGTALAVVLAVIVAGYVAINTDAGRRQLLSYALARAQPVFGGRATLSVGALDHIGLRAITVRDVALRDTAGAVVLQAARVASSLDWSALRKRVIHLRTLDVQDATLDLRQDFDGPWNIAFIISGAGPRTPPRAVPTFGDDVRVDQLRLSRVAINTSVPWAPHPVFRGRARDSVIAVRDSLHDLVRMPRGFLERRRVSLTSVLGHDGAIVRPHGAPSSIRLDSVVGLVSDPPVRIVAAAGDVQWTPDSLRFSLPTLRLPNSRGSTKGVVTWNAPGPAHYAADITANAGLQDLTWMWDVLPTSGEGRIRVQLRTLADANNVEYVLRDMDMAAMRSRILGRVTVESRPAELLLRDVDLRFTPISSDLLRRLSYEALPREVRGTFVARLVARTGGSLGNFLIDQFDARFTDERAANAISTINMNGRVTLGRDPVARNLIVQDVSVDLRSARLLAPSFKADGVVKGSATVRLATLRGADVRAIDLTWTDAVGHASTVRGDATITLPSKVRSRGSAAPMTVLAQLQLDPISLRALARIDTTVPTHVALRGPVRVEGPLDNLQWSATLAAPDGGQVALQGSATMSASTWAVRADGTVDAFDARVWLTHGEVAATTIDGRVRFDAHGTRGPRGVLLAGATTSIALTQQETRTRLAMNLVGAGRIDTAHLTVDSATMRVGGITLDAHGRLARHASTDGNTSADTLVVSARADSLAAVGAALPKLADMMSSRDTAITNAMRRLAADTFAGDLRVSGYLFGSLTDVGATLALAAQSVQIGTVRAGRVFGSVEGATLLTAPRVDGAATFDEVRGLGALNISTANVRVRHANADSGRLTADLRSADDARLEMRGAYARANGAIDVAVDSLRFGYDANVWRNTTPIRLHHDARGVRVDSVSLRSSSGQLVLVADVPNTGPVRIEAGFDRFPFGEAMGFGINAPAFSGAVTGDLRVTGTRDAPIVAFNLLADSVGRNGMVAPPLRVDGAYADRRMRLRAVLADSVHGVLRAEARLPLDLALRAVSKRMLSEVVDAEIVANALLLDSLPLASNGIDQLRGVLNGRLALSGTMERPVATGTMTLDRFSANVAALGITPRDGRMVLRAAQDSLILENFRLRSGGPSDTLSARGAMRFASGQPSTMQLSLFANNFAASRQKDGTDLNVGGRVELVGPLKRPALSGVLTVPTATLFANPLAATTALDLTTAAVRELLGLDEVPVAASAAQSFARLGNYVTLDRARIELGNDVWVRTPEAKVKVIGSLSVTTDSDLLTLDGEVTAERGQYRLALGVVTRSFSVDSGKIRFFGSANIAPTLDISATNVVRRPDGEEIPVHVHIGGTIDQPLVSLSSSDPLYARAPESEIISLLIFGEPTFALDGPRQSTVRSVTGVLLPSVGGAVEGLLQNLLPGLSTFQVVTGGVQSKEEPTLNSLLENVSIAAGKQFGGRTYLRVNTGVCRGAQPWAAVSVEYRITRELTAQVGVDPGAAPCARLGADALAPRQFGFDLFRSWIF